MRTSVRVTHAYSAMAATCSVTLATSCIIRSCFGDSSRVCSIHVIVAMDEAMLISWLTIQHLFPVDSNSDLQAKLTQLELASASLHSGNFTKGACKDWDLAAAPFHCMYRTQAYSLLTALSLTASVLTALLPVYIRLIKVVFSCCKRRV